MFDSSTNWHQYCYLFVCVAAASIAIFFFSLLVWQWHQVLSFSFVCLFVWQRHQLLSFSFVCLCGSGTNCYLLRCVFVCLFVWQRHQLPSFCLFVRSSVRSSVLSFFSGTNCHRDSLRLDFIYSLRLDLFDQDSFQ